MRRRYETATNVPMPFLNLSSPRQRGTTVECDGRGLAGCGLSGAEAFGVGGQLAEVRSVRRCESPELVDADL